MPSQYQRPLPSGQTTAGWSEACSRSPRTRSRGRSIRIVVVAAPRLNDAAAKSPSAKHRAISERNGSDRAARACAQCASSHFQYFSAGERSLPWRRRRRRGRLCLQREQRRIGGGRRGVDRVQVHRQPLRGAQPGGAVRRPLVVPQPSLDRSQRRQPAIAATVLASGDVLGRRERAVVVERPALEQQVRAAADVRLQRAHPLDPAKAPAQRPVRPPQRALDTHPIDDRTGREGVPRARADLIAKCHQSLTRLDSPRGSYSRWRRNSYTPGATRSRSCSSWTRKTGSSPTTCRYLAAGLQGWRCSDARSSSTTCA